MRAQSTQRKQKIKRRAPKAPAANASQQSTIRFPWFCDTYYSNSHRHTRRVFDAALTARAWPKPINDGGEDGGGRVDGSVGNGRGRGGGGVLRPFSSERIDESVQLWRVFSVGGSQRNARRSEQVHDQDQPFLRAPVERLVQLAIVEHHYLAFIVSPKLPDKSISSGTGGVVEGREIARGSHGGHGCGASVLVFAAKLFGWLVPASCFWWAMQQSAGPKTLSTTPFLHGER